ncbi:hypothetical protein QTQ03_11430 [Micromonospora sp. WMMA1363]|uniref:hypothetical protein n=1 Tax=Micromonospora sp. WMMA1363 TaxID=3053985 RepID=UPI00259CEC52|nr:hypothetical protein [Micromonospora sp. WMMA1363]MDM4720158.1 hypothetical protein [Micromonospora sp. WMMA1363]
MITVTSHQRPAAPGGGSAAPSGGAGNPAGSSHDPFVDEPAAFAAAAERFLAG